MAGPWLFAVSTALSILSVRADVVIGAPIAGNLLDHGGHLNARQLSSNGSLTSSLTPVATFCGTSGGLNPHSGQNNDFQTISATATLPNGQSTVFATRVRRLNGQLAALTDTPDAAHLVSGTDGCSTLFTPTTYSACSTVVSPLGLPPVTITECNQYVTFSSETLFMCPPTPMITPKPASESPSSRLAGSFTTRPFSQNDTFMNASTTYTPGADSNDIELASSSTRSISAASGMPMSLPRYIQAEKRQVLFDHNGRPMETEAAIIAPGKHFNPRQLMFDPHGGEAITDLTTIAPPITISEGSIQPTNMPVRHVMMASGMTGKGNVKSPNATATGIDGPVVTRLIPIPDVLKAKYKRKYIAIGHKVRDDEASDVTTSSNRQHIPALRRKDIRAALRDSRIRPHARRFVDAVPSSLVSNNTLTDSTRPSAKLAKLETIRLANAAYAARDAQAPNAINLSPPSPTKFYAAPWSEITEGGVPEHVLGITCYGGGDHVGKCTTPDSDGDPEECECVTERQSWSVSSITVTRIGETIISYSGAMVITGAGGAVTTTNVNLFTTMETTRSFVESFVTRKTLTGEDTVTKTMTSVPSATVTVMPVGDSKAAAPQDAPASSSGADEASTLVLTSYVATETVTVPSSEETGPTGGDLSGLDNASGYETVLGTESGGSMDATKVKRDDSRCQSDPNCWPSDAWMVKLKTGGMKEKAGSEK